MKTVIYNKETGAEYRVFPYTAGNWENGGAYAVLKWWLEMED